MRPNKRLTRRLDPGDVQRVKNMPRPRVLQRRHHLGVPNRVAVNFSHRRKSGVEARRGPPGRHDADRRRQVGIQSLPPAMDREQCLWNLDMSALPEGVHTGIRAARSVNRDPGPRNFRECGLERILNRPSSSLALPSRKFCPVISDDQPKPHTCESSQL